MVSFDPYASGVLKEEVHGALVADLDRRSKHASIQPHWVCYPLGDWVNADAVEWVRNFHTNSEQGVHGLLLEGISSATALDQCSAIAGALLRNFIDARVVTVSNVYESLRTGDPLDPTCLLIPNFFVGAGSGVQLASWEISKFYDLLVDRVLRGRSTVLYAHSTSALSSEFGAGIWDLVNKSYTITSLSKGVTK